MRVLTLSALFLALALLMSACRTSDPFDFDQRFDLEAIPVVWGGNRVHQGTFRVPPETWRRFKTLFEPPAETPREERERIAQGIALMEKIAGLQTPLRFDLGQNARNGSNQEILNCVDETRNTSVFLNVFEQQGLLRWHEVRPPIRRTKNYFIAHNTAQIRDVSTGVNYAVDSWWRDNGELSYVQLAEDWLGFVELPESIP